METTNKMGHRRLAGKVSEAVARRFPELKVLTNVYVYVYNLIGVINYGD